MIEALIYLGYSVAALIVLIVLYATEDSVGHKLFLVRLRDAVDVRLTKVSLSRVFLGRGFFRLLLHYGVNSVLKRLSYFLHKCEKRVASLASHNRSVAKEIKPQKKHRTHLDEIADHKSEVALSESEKKKMRSH